MRTLHSQLRLIQESLAVLYPDSVMRSAHAWWFIESAVGKTKTQLLAEHDFFLSARFIDHIAQMVQSHIKEHKPMAYIIGNVPFCGLTISVSAPTLIARPETEEWCTYLLDILQPYKTEPLMILDMCTGSGCIALALAAALPKSQVWAADIDERACALVQKNAAHNNIKNIVVCQSDLFANLKRSQKFDLIVSNPPYVTELEWSNLHPSVTQWEDKKALVAADDGFAFIEKIVKEGSLFLNRSSKICEKKLPQLMVEIGYKQSIRAQKIFIAENIEPLIWYDSANHGRVICGILRIG